jgi:hypothetical protein
MILTNTHMTSINPLPWLLILVIGLLITGGIKAHTIDVLEEIFTTFAVNQNVTITDAVGYNPTTRAAQVDSTLWVSHKVELFFNTEVLPAADAGKNFKCTVVVEITKRFDSSVSTETPFQKTLTAYYDKNLGVVFDGESAYFFEDIKYKVRYRIISIAYEVDGISVGSVTTGLFGLRGVMMIDRVWKMSLTSYMSLDTPSYSGSLMRLTSSWSAFQGAEEYDFEWTFYDTLSAVYADYYANTTYANFEELFRDNASRMTVNKGYFQPRLVFPHTAPWSFDLKQSTHEYQNKTKLR